MGRDEKGHVSREELARSVVDEADLKVMSHIEACPECRKARADLKASLDLLGRTAREYAPEKVRKVVLPERGLNGQESWTLRWASALSFAAALVVLVIVWNMNGQVREPVTASMAQQTREEAALMTEIATLEENSLPDAYDEISPEESSASIDEDTLDFLVPGDDDSDSTGKEA